MNFLTTLFHGEIIAQGPLALSASAGHDMIHTVLISLLLAEILYAQCHRVTSTLQFRALESYDSPVIIESAATNWTAIQKWTLPYLRDVLQEVSFPQGNIDSILSNPNSYIFSKIDPVSGFLVTSDDEDKNDLDFEPHQRRFLPLLDVDVGSFPFFEHDHSKVHHFLLIGGVGSGLCFHNHEEHAFNALLRGTKTWYFYPPNVNTLGLDPHGYPYWWRDDTAEGRYEFANTIVPRLTERPFECHQEAGDIMFVPSLWHHMVINQNKNTVAVNAIKSRTTYFT